MFWICNILDCRSQWPRGLRRRSTAARLLRSWVLIPPRAWMFVCCVCCQVERSLRRADHSYRGILPTVARRCVWSRNLVDEEAIARTGLQCQRIKQHTTLHYLTDWLSVTLSTITYFIDCSYIHWTKFCTVVPPYPQVIRSKTYRSYIKPQIIPNAIYNVIFV
jgi:hypothetical protein